MRYTWYFVVIRLMWESLFFMVPVLLSFDLAFSDFYLIRLSGLLWLHLNVRRSSTHSSAERNLNFLIVLLLKLLNKLRYLGKRCLFFDYWDKISQLVTYSCCRPLFDLKSPDETSSVPRCYFAPHFGLLRTSHYFPSSPRILLSFINF